MYFTNESKLFIHQIENTKSERKTKKQEKIKPRKRKASKRKSKQERENNQHKTKVRKRQKSRTMVILCRINTANMILERTSCSMSLLSCIHQRMLPMLSDIVEMRQVC
jgi:hypothetical protein